LPSLVPYPTLFRSERITLDLSGDEGTTTSNLMDKGWYEAIIYSAEDKETGPQSKNPGSPYIAAVVTITEPGDHFEKQVNDRFIGLYVTENAPGLANKAKQLARVTGLWDGEDKSNVVLPNAEDIEGTEVEVLVRVERNEFAERQYEDENGEAPDEPIYQNTIGAYRPRGGWDRPAAAGGKGKTGGKKRSVTL